MRLVRYHVAVSLDGFIATRTGGTGWLAPYAHVVMDFLGPWLKQIGGVIVGRASYDAAIDRGGWMWGAMPGLVMTNRRIEKGPQSVHAHAGDPVLGLGLLRERMRKEDRDGDIWLFGGGVTAGGFLKRNLIDRVELAVIPVALGKGRTLFAGGGARARFAHASSHPLGMGVILNSYDGGAAFIQPRAGPRS